MGKRFAEMTPEDWLLALWSSQAARNGGVVRRKTADVERVVGRDAFEAELNRRGFQAVENAGQFVVFCNREPLRVINSARPKFLARNFAKLL